MIKTFMILKKHVTNRYYVEIIGEKKSLAERNWASIDSNSSNLAQTYKEPIKHIIE